jgi:hypothetical protein
MPQVIQEPHSSQHSPKSSQHSQPQKQSAQSIIPSTWIQPQKYKGVIKSKQGKQH